MAQATALPEALVRGPRFRLHGDLVAPPRSTRGLSRSQSYRGESAFSVGFLDLACFQTINQ